MKPLEGRPRASHLFHSPSSSLSDEGCSSLVRLRAQPFAGMRTEVHRTSSLNGPTTSGRRSQVARPPVETPTAECGYCMLQRNSIISPEDDAWSNRTGKRISVIEYCQSLMSVVRRERLDGATVEFAAMACARWP